MKNIMFVNDFFHHVNSSTLVFKNDYFGCYSKMKKVARNFCTLTINDFVHVKMFVHTLPIHQLSRIVHKTPLNHEFAHRHSLVHVPSQLLRLEICNQYTKRGGLYAYCINHVIQWYKHSSVLTIANTLRRMHGKLVPIKFSCLYNNKSVISYCQ